MFSCIHFVVRQTKRNRKQIYTIHSNDIGNEANDVNKTNRNHPWRGYQYSKVQQRTEDKREF